MFLVLAYGLVAFTGLIVFALLWMAWEHRRDESSAEREKRSPAKFHPMSSSIAPTSAMKKI
jgi:hypothetical protein